MKILAIADIHNDLENLMGYLDKVSEMDFDVIVCPGDFTDVEPKGFTSEEIGRIVLEELKSLGKPIVAVPGNWDRDIINILEEEGVSVHGKGKIIENVGFYGFGGAKTPFNTKYEPSEEEIEAGLRKAFKEIKDATFKVQVTHAPPFETRLDMAFSGAHVGSKVVRALIEEFKPVVAICAHIHEGRGTDRIRDTLVVNPGRFPEGYCALVEVGERVNAELVNLT